MNSIIRFLLYLLFIFAGNIFFLNSYGQNSKYKADSLIKLIPSVSDTEKVNLLLELSKCIDCTDSTKLSYAAKASDIAEQKKWEKGVFNANRMTGNIYFDSKNYQLAIEYFQRSVSIAKIAGDNLRLASALDDIAQAYTQSAQFSKALDYNRELLALNPPINFINGALANIGGIYKNVGDYNNALVYFDSSLKITDELIRTTKTINYRLQKGGLLADIGNIYLAISQYDKALENYNNAQKISLETKNDFLNVEALRSIGKTYYCKKDYNKSIENYLIALADSKQLTKQIDEVRTLNELGNVYMESGEIDKALECALNALNLAEKNNYIVQLPLIYTTLGKIYTARKKYTTAVDYLQKAVAICGKNCSLVNERDAWEALRNTYDQMKQPARAYEAYQHFISIRDSIYNIDIANKLIREGMEAEFSRQKLTTAAENKLKMQKQQIYTFSAVAGLLLVVLLSFFIYRNYAQQKQANVVIREANYTIGREKQKSEMLLLNTLPGDVAEELKNKGSVKAKLFEHVTIMFTDFVNFTEAGERFSPEGLVTELDNCFKAFDNIVSKYNIEKIKTVGDAYLAVSGLPNPTPDHANEIVKAAIEIRDFMMARKKELGDNTFGMRIGIHSGTVVAGIVGVKKFAYDIWGDAVNTAARMEQYSDPDKINISQTTYELVKDKFSCIDRGEIDAKHKGKMRMYFVEN